VKICPAFTKINNGISFNIFSSPFNIDVETVPDELQMELIDLQNDTDLRNKFQNVDT
jgi:hypothetical protein